MKKTKYAVFYAEKLPSGFYAIYANGNPEYIDASQRTPDGVRKIIDAIMKVNGITSSAETFHKESYEYFLTEYAKFYGKECKR